MDAPIGRSRSRLTRAIVVSTLFVMLPYSACREAETEAFSVVPGGDPSRGKVAIREYGCGSCHTIPGVTGADGLVGPGLDRVARRIYIAGVLPNSPDDLIRWIRHPQEVAPRTAMPDMGVTERDARDIAAYLYTLK